MTPGAIRFEKLVVGRGGRPLAGPIDLVLGGGEALVVIGPNGAGKSTLLRTLAGLMRPISGLVRPVGLEADDGEMARKVHEIAHYVGHRNAMKANVTVGANLRFWRHFLRAKDGRSDDEAIESAMEAVALGGVLDIPFGYLSAGQQRRASLARLLVASRPLWILDEPTSALDVGSQASFAALLTDHLSREGMVIAATHQPLGLDEARSLDLGAEDMCGLGNDDREIDDAERLALEGWA